MKKTPQIEPDWEYTIAGIKRTIACTAATEGKPCQKHGCETPHQPDDLKHMERG